MEKRNSQLYSSRYDVYLRIAVEGIPGSEAEAIENADVVLDIAEVPFIPFH